MHPPFAESPEFRRLLARERPADLIGIALEIARDAYPDLEPEVYLEKIEAMAARIRDRCPAGAKPRHVLGQINWVLFVEEGFRGNTAEYYDPRNSYLNEVIDRRAGIPITLSLLYWTLAERVGLSMSGVNLPAHFLLRTEEAGAMVFVDPFESGVLLDRHGCERRIAAILGRPVMLDDADLAPCEPEQVVSRMLRNLKAIYLRAQDYPAALPVQRRLAALERSDPQQQRDLGMICIQLDLPSEAITPLQSYLESTPEADDAGPLRALLREARREVATWN